MSEPTISLNPRRRRLLRAAAHSPLLLLTGLADTVQAAQVVAVRVWPAADYTRVTLEHDNELTFSHFVVKDPHRLVVDIEGLSLNDTVRNLVSKITPNDPYIAQVRVGQNRPKVVRLVFDLKEEVQPQVFSLQPVGEYQHRLVLDLYPSTPRDGLLALMQEGKFEGKLDHKLERLPNALGQNLPPNNGISPPPNSPEANLTPNNKNENRSDDEPVLKMNRLLTIALDPGHGGEDPGAVGKAGSYEKNVVLSIAQRLKRHIEQESNLRVLLTRDADYFVPLHVRVQKARRVQADLFVSLHADAFIKPDARGSSVFALSEQGATSTAARWLANKENAADLIGGINIHTRDAQLAKVLLDLSTTAQINDSLKLGKAVLREISGINRLHKNDVEQAGFAVLKAPDIPSILIETAFISNPEEEARLNDEDYQERLARAVLSGIKRYFAKNPPLTRNKLAQL